MRARTASLIVGILVLTGCTGDPALSPSPTSAGATNSRATPAAPASAPAANWVVTENARAGSRGWNFTGPIADATQLAGFADHTSITPGQPVILKVTSTAASWHAEVYRLGYYQGSGGRLVLRTPQIPATKQPGCRTLAGHEVSCANWAPSTTIATPGWLPGSYLIKLVGSDNHQKLIPLTVSSSSYTGTLLFVSATSTYAAYNAYGGYSLYKGPTPSSPRASIVSYDRPYDGVGAMHAYGYEQPYVYLAEKLGLDMSYTTSQGLEAGAKHFAGIRGVISPGHDEYWSVPTRTTVEQLRDAGANVAFLGANAVYWRIRYVAGGRAVLAYKDDSDPVSGPQRTNLWRRYRPESSLTGQLYECFPAEGALTVLDPGFFLFAGTGAKKGSSYPGLIGREIDRAYPSPLAPASLHVAAHSGVACADRGPTYSDFTYYTAPSGAGVVDVGTMGWHTGLEKPKGRLTAASAAFATRVTTNLFRAMAAGPMGRSHPATPNLAALHPSASTTTGTGGAVTGTPS